MRWLLASAGAVVVAAAAAAANPASPESGAEAATARAGSATPAATRRASGRNASGQRGPRGVRGTRGLRGTSGLIGPRGARGLSGPASSALLHQSVAVSWQDGAWQGHDRAGFQVPGVGSGELVCRPDTQWIRIFPADGSQDVAMTLVRLQDDETVVRTAKHEQHTGPDFHEGLNRHAGEGVSTGAMQGILASRGPQNGSGGPAAPPTTVSLNWHWNFEDGAPRCYVAATLTTGSAA